MFDPYIHIHKKPMNNLPQVHFSGQTPGLVLFEKRAIIELSSDEMMEINGGTTPLCLVAAGAAIVWSSIQIGRAIYGATH